MITTRDGIVGPWKVPGTIPVPHEAESSRNLPLWEPTVCDTIFGFELASRLGFTAGPSAHGSADPTLSVWHLKVSPGPNDTPVGTYQPLVRFDRPSEATFAAQLRFMRSHADLRPDRATEIIEQLDGPAPFMASIAWLRPDSKRWTLALIEAVMDLARFVEQRVKHGLACRRPIEYSPQVQPIIPTPGHGTLPSGHATESFASALVLWRLLQAGKAPYGDPGYGEQFMRLASRIAINRTVAGVHFPIDSVAGALLGLTLGDYFLARVGAVGRTYQPAHFDGKAVGTTVGKDEPEKIEDKDFRWSEIYDVAAAKVRFYGGGLNGHPSVTPWGNPIDLAENNFATNTDVTAALLSPLEWLWRRALAEWT